MLDDITNIGTALAASQNGEAPVIVPAATGSFTFEAPA
jgi:hypothetical protein